MSAAKDTEDAIYDRLAVEIRAACCADRRKPCMEHAVYLDGVEMALMAPEAVAAVADAARLRSLAAIFDSHLNRDKTFTGSEVASMLRDGKGFDDSDIMPGSEFDGPVVL